MGSYLIIPEGIYQCPPDQSEIQEYLRDLANSSLERLDATNSMSIHLKVDVPNHFGRFANAIWRGVLKVCNFDWIHPTLQTDDGSLIVCPTVLKIFQELGRV